MKRSLSRFASSVLIFLLLIGSPGAGQVSARTPQETRPAVEVLLEAKVLSIPYGALGPLGVSQPGSGPGNLKSFLLPLAESEVRSLVDNPRTRTVHSLTLHATPGNRTQFRVDTRVPGNSSAGIDTYFLLGIGLEATPTLRANRVVSLLTGSVVQIRRGPAPAGGVALLFETPLTRHEIQIPEGMTILMGGFVASSSVPAVPEMATTPGNPIVNYIFSNGPKKEDDPEIVVMLTPRLVGVTDPVFPAAPPPARLPISEAPSPSQPELPVAAAAAPVPAVASVPPPMPDLSVPATALTPGPRVDLPAAPAIPAPAVTAKILIPASVASAPPTKADLPVPIIVTLAPATRFDLPVPVSAPPAPAAKAKVLIPASVASAPPARANLPVPSTVELAPATRFDLPAPVSAPPAPAAKADLPILVSAASPSSLLSIASAPPAKPGLPVPVSVSLAPAPRLNLPVPASLPPPPAHNANLLLSVQVGAFRDRTNADALVAEMKKRFGGAFIDSDETARTPYRVRVGRLPSLTAARQLQRRLRDLGFDSFVVFPKLPS